MGFGKSERASILIIDDTPANLSVLFDYLRESGFKTLVAEDGEEGITHAEHARPDIILLDIMMPGIDGFETCRRLKENEVTKDIPIIFVTAIHETFDKVRGFSLGAVDYVTKPFQQEEVLARIRTHLTIQHQKKKLLDLNAKLGETNARLVESNATKDKFFSIIAHDMKSAFNVLISGSKLLAEPIRRYSAEEIEQFAQEMLGASQKTFRLLQNLLNWAKIQRDMMEFEPMKMDFYWLASDAVAIFQKAAEQKEIDLSHAVESGVYVHADLDMTNTILRNIIFNAIKFTSRGGNVGISARPVEDALVQVSVSDTGIGISEEDQQKLFKIDNCHKETGTEGEKGSGLGLILSKELVKKKRGEHLA